MKSLFLLTAISTLSITLASGSAVLAQSTPPGLSDLVGARGAGGETQLEARGYQHVSTQTGTDRKWSYWWNPRLQQCISVSTVDGHYASIVSTLPADCGRSGGSDAGYNDVPQVMVGRNGQGEVIFKGNNCVAYYDAYGRRSKALPACSGGQISHADEAMMRYRREQGMDGPAADHSPDHPGHGAGVIRLTCFGEGHRPQARTYPILRWDRRDHEFDTDYATIMSKREFDTMVQIDIRGRTGNIWLPKSLIPPVHSGGDHGWWELRNLAVTGSQITGSYKLNGLNKPKVTIDRRRDRISIKGQRDFKGTCEASGG